VVTGCKTIGVILEHKSPVEGEDQREKKKSVKVWKARGGDMEGPGNGGSCHAWRRKRGSFGKKAVRGVRGN